MHCRARLAEQQRRCIRNQVQCERVGTRLFNLSWRNGGVGFDAGLGIAVDSVATPTSLDKLAQRIFLWPIRSKTRSAAASRTAMPLSRRSTQRVRRSFIQPTSAASDNDVALPSLWIPRAAPMSPAYYFNKLSDRQRLPEWICRQRGCLCYQDQSNRIRHSLFRLTWAASITMQAMTLQSTLLSMLMSPAHCFAELSLANPFQATFAAFW